MWARLWIFILPLTGLLTLVPGWSPYMRMVAICGSVFVILKWHALAAHVPVAGAELTWGDKFSWMVLWPGLDADAFFGRQAVTTRSEAVNWMAALAKTLLGGVLLFLLAPAIVPSSPATAAWIAMTGIVLLMHCGLFHLLALLWRMAGRNVRPLMNAPVFATSIGEFWGQRWNLAFRDFSFRFVFRPVARHWNTTAGTWAGFIFSGLVHELAISVPAGGGFGLPLSYFLLQGAGVSLERSAIRRGVCTGRGIAGWLYTAAFTVPAAFLLFHPPFVNRIILPLINAI